MFLVHSRAQYTYLTWLTHHSSHFSGSIPVADPGFPGEGSSNPKGGCAKLLIGQMFFQKLRKNGRNWTEGALLLRPPPLDPSMHLIPAWKAWNFPLWTACVLIVVYFISLWGLFSEFCQHHLFPANHKMEVLLTLWQNLFWKKKFISFLFSNRRVFIKIIIEIIELLLFQLNLTNFKKLGKKLENHEKPLRFW